MEPIEAVKTEPTQEPGRGVDMPDGESPPALSVVIPAYNEADRLPATLTAVIEFLRTRDYSWEIIVADDGSEDATPAIASAAALAPTVRHLRLPHRGKAATVRDGVLAAEGDVVVFTDADLSTPIAYVDRVRDLIASGWEVVIGTREGAGARRLGEPFYRHLMGRAYNYAVRLLVVRGISDTQCGFKAFRRQVARDLFTRSRLYRDTSGALRGPLVTGFDVEILFLARKGRYRMCELPVTWHHVAGSKVRPGLDALLMLRDVLNVRVNDLRRRYSTETRADAGCAERGV
ncbi:MAG TPA: dolichyl-phosphate beta-glucosyltransferase [Thermomicrobiaceae bacterium]|nr:dolichyl-phosphate beta-glucosyltransferase [Thermomicrobiaceae bacterium]